MSKEKPTLIEELTWPEIRDKVANSCKKLAAIIDEISPSNEFTFFKILYPFGTKIFKKNTFFLPSISGGSIPITDSENDNNAKNKLSYSALPLGIITKNTVELFFDINRKIFSLALFSKGLDLGIWEHFGWSNQYNVTSGARSLYMLPKISESLSHKQLKKRFGVTESPPKNFYDQWKVFSQLSQSSNFPTNWFCEVIFLSSRLVDAIKNNPSYSKLALYISQKGWQHSGYGRKKASLEMVWEIFVKSLSDKELKFDPYVVDTLKHLIYVSIGAIPGSAPSTGNDETGPLKTIQTIYQESKGYGLDGYIATIMQPQYFSIARSKPTYYSLQLPTLLESLPRTKKITSVIDNVRELSELLDFFIKEHSDLWTNLVIGNIPLSSTLNKLQIDYFHGDMFAYGNTIKSSLKMPDHDPRLKYDPLNEKKRTFASNSSFLRGCVRLTTKPPPTSSLSETNKT